MANKKSDQALTHAIREATEDLAIAISDAWHAGLTVEMPQGSWWSSEMENDKRLCVAHHVEVYRRF